MDNQNKQDDQPGSSTSQNTDLLATKQTMDGYITFPEERPAIVPSNPGISDCQIEKELEEKWKLMSNAVKQLYQADRLKALPLVREQLGCDYKPIPKLKGPTAGGSSRVNSVNRNNSSSPYTIPQASQRQPADVLPLYSTPPPSSSPSSARPVESGMQGYEYPASSAQTTPSPAFGDVTRGNHYGALVNSLLPNNPFMFRYPTAGNVPLFAAPSAAALSAAAAAILNGNPYAGRYNPSMYNRQLMLRQPTGSNVPPSPFAASSAALRDVMRGNAAPCKPSLPNKPFMSRRPPVSNVSPAALADILAVNPYADLTNILLPNNPSMFRYPTADSVPNEIPPDTSGMGSNQHRLLALPSNTFGHSGSTNVPSATSSDQPTDLDNTGRD